MVVVSGSVSPTTASQIAFALSAGFVSIGIDAAALIEGGTASTAVEDAAVAAARTLLANGNDPIIQTALGPDDPAVAAARCMRDTLGLSAEEANSRIGQGLGRILSRILRETGVRRAIISGGDTSGEVTAALGIFALSALAPTVPGASLLRTHAESPEVDGLELALKGGQMGSEDYFAWIRDGRRHDSKAGT